MMEKYMVELIQKEEISEFFENEDKNKHTINK